MDIIIKNFDELGTTELYQLLQLRSAVFVVEQHCVYQDMDGKDKKAVHVLGKANGNIVAYLRMFRSGDYFDTASIGRVVVGKTSRKKGYAKMLMDTAMAHLTTHLKEEKINLSAQTYLQDFYRDLGFRPINGEYMEDGIPHIKMVYG